MAFKCRDVSMIYFLLWHSHDDEVKGRYLITVNLGPRPGVENKSHEIKNLKNNKILEVTLELDIRSLTCGRGPGSCSRCSSLRSISRNLILSFGKSRVKCFH